MLRTIGFSYLPTILALGLIFLLMFRREVHSTLFPFRAYLNQCLSIRGLENEPHLQAQFRRELGKALLGLFPERSPTACCCLLSTDTGYDGVLTVHSSAGQFQVRVNAGSPIAVTTALLEKLSELNGPPIFELNCKGLLPRCKDCSLRKAHRLVNRSYSSLIPRSRGLLTVRYLRWLRGLTSRH